MKNSNKVNKKTGYKSWKNKPIIYPGEIILVICILVLICVNIILVIKNILEPKSEQEKNAQMQEQQQQTTSQDQQITSEEYQLSLLKQGTERDRIEYYCGQFFKCIENKNYTKAYEMLYPEFKENYFPTIEKFKEYVQKTYPSKMSIYYDDFDRQGDIYITVVKISDLFSENSEETFTQRIVVKENDYNNYVLSFQVI